MKTNELKEKQNQESWGVKGYFEVAHPRLERWPKFKVVKLGKARAWLNANAAFVGWGQSIGRESAASIKQHSIRPYYHLVSKTDWASALAKRGAVVIEDGDYRPHSYPAINVRAGHFETANV